jgi:flagellar biosynthesis/type III secretory pathway protein FliH
MAASNDVKELVVDICEELIQREAPDILLPWLERALAILASKRSVTVQVRQRYFSSAATHLQAHHLGVQVVAAPPTQAAELVLVTESGEISFAWRTALEELLKARITK